MIRGVDRDGRRHFFGFGRNDLGQLPKIRGASSDLDSESDAPLNVPTTSAEPSGVASSSVGMMSELPNGAALFHVWCGSEFTMACGSDGRLWARGWNDHGNLGCGRICTIADCWYPVIVAAGAGGGAGAGDVEEDDECASEIAHARQLVLDVTRLWDGSMSCGGSHCLCLI